MRAALFLSAALIAAPAFAQTASNDQLQLRGVTALTDVEVGRAHDVGANAVASGNVVTGVSDGRDATYRSRQHMDGDARAETNATVWHASGVVSASASALGNGLTTITTNGDLDLNAEQRAHGDATAITRFTGADAGDAATSASAAGNVAAVSHENGQARVILSQESTGDIGAETDAEHCCVAGQAVSAAVASANNATLAGATTTSLSDVRQTAAGPSVSARVDIFAGYPGDISGNAAASSNALTIANEWGYANARARQSSSADISADAYVTLGGDFLGFASAGAFGVGNAVTASNVGSDMSLDIGQENSGHVSANAALAGEGGDLAVASSAAYGNSISAALCGYCEAGASPTLSATANQINDGDVLARASISTARARSVGANATAIGNAATFQATGAN